MSEDTFSNFNQNRVLLINSAGAEPAWRCDLHLSGVNVHMEGGQGFQAHGRNGAPQSLHV